MAKSVRSSVRKRNSAKLRSTVFGPVVDARTDRLSAKLRELAAQPRPETTQDTAMDMDTSISGDQTKDSSTDSKMILDNSKETSTVSTINRSRSNRVKKLGRKKNRSSIVFSKPIRRSKSISKKR